MQEHKTKECVFVGILGQVLAAPFSQITLHTKKDQMAFKYVLRELARPFNAVNEIVHTELVGSETVPSCLRELVAIEPEGTGGNRIVK